ncbi:hypothetical protein ZYGR_0I07100 [Zygosaccharomyces rouxii]|uniref:ZYRO0C16786p n=2 Tax=Zygosaccharomyces rouxii TaxID=4956 RepID=C5DUH4_ZYGRC|nr:uncharacterized protein ZYRO0C16786g [Zygosaccharomyces rouxii]KAH9201395.1 hypothetical protein LQ764DRAFT_233210 [Zygosaccharomyces rouxii]GAV48413.1 hypothetical protein ZYGR_0I07100 [Zygosaccharomyces rouxii]CAR27435.1 ZYRO0C16786p [Zygosaccharomyces rouxii]
MCSCLYLRNLPRRPQSRDHYIRNLLKCINHSNPFALNHELPLPQHETIGNDELKLLDEPNGVVDISISKTLTSQCFITFINESSAQSFQEKGLTVHGRNIDIQVAKRDSLLGLSIKNPSLLQRVLKSRRQRLDKEKWVNKRRSRRLRSKLRRKGLSEDEISKQLATQLSKPKREVKRQTDDDNTSRPTNAKVVTTENPPNKVLLVQGLPQDCQLSELEPIFKNDGFVEVRLVAIRKVAFVEYDSISHATAQLNSMGELYEFKGHRISIGFAK